MNAKTAFSVLLAGLLAMMPGIAVAQSSTNFKSPAFSVNAGVRDMASANFNARASVGHAFGPAALSSANFSVATGLLAIQLTTGATGATGNIRVFNTGVAANGSLLPGGSVDPHYTLIASAEPTLPGPNAIVTTQIADGYWMPQGPNSKWIAPSANQSYAPTPIPCNASGTYAYRTLIDLTGLDPATAVIQGQWAADNQGTEIRLNGVSIDLAQPGYNPFVAFTLNGDFVAGVNTLDFVTSDQGCPNGLRVEFLSAAASIATGGPLTPGPPTNLIAVAGNAQATFTFTAPASNGGSPITSYRVDCGTPAISVSGASSPLTVTGLTNGTSYACVAFAINALGAGAASSAVNVTPSMAVLPALVKVVSRKSHGAAGTFDLLLDRTQSLGGSITVEPRAIGSGHKIVFQFDVPVTFGVATAIDEAGAPVVVASAVVGGNNTVVVTLNGVPDNKRVKVSLSNVNGVDFSAPLGFLLGDVNNSRSITPNDVQQTKSRSGQMADAINFGSDLNATGAITAADIVAIKSRTPRTLVDVVVQPPFTMQPVGITISEGQNAQFTVATSGTPSPTLQWQLSTDNGVNWSNIAGETNNVLNVVAATLANSGRQYRVVATFSTGPVTSNAATLTVNPAIIIPASTGKIAAGPSHTCAIKADGTVACWGRNSRREVTPSNGFDQDVPVVVPGLTGMTQVAVGFQHSCAIDSTGTLICWGGSQTSVATIKDGNNVNYTGVKGVALGTAHTCFIDSLTNVLCWGDNSVGQLGQGTISAAFVTTPVFVQRYTGVLTGVISLSAGDFHTCALTSGGDVVCWGRGAIGDGSPALPGFESIGTQLATKAAVAAASGARGMTSGLSHACAVLVAGGVKCWGYNNHGQLGNGNTSNQLFPVSVADPAGLLTGATNLAAQSANSCALSANGRVVCWGAVLPGSVNGINTYQPSAQGSTTGLKALVSGGAHSCALTGVGGMECWGANQNGQLGVGGTIGVITGGPAPPQSTVSGGAIFWN